MSRKMVIAAVAAAGVVGLGSAAVANVGPLGNIKDTVTSSASVDDAVTQKLGGSGQLTAVLGTLESQLNGGQLSLNSAQFQQGSAKLATALDGLAAKVRSGSVDLASKQVQTADDLADKMEMIAERMRSFSPEDLSEATGSVGLNGNVSEDGGASVSGNGSASGEEMSGSLSGGGAMSLQETFMQLRVALSQVQQLDQQDALSGSAGDILDSGSAEAQLGRVTSQLQSLLG